MKKVRIISSGQIKIIFCVCIIMIGVFKSLAQQIIYGSGEVGKIPKFISNQTITSSIISENNSKIGIGTSLTNEITSKLTVVSSGCSEIPLLQTYFTGWGNGNSVKISFCDPPNEYGIRQIGPSVVNHFDGHLGIGGINTQYPFFVEGQIGLTDKLNFLGYYNGILSVNSPEFSISMKDSPLSPVLSPLRIYPSKVKIVDSLECNEFRLTTHAQSGSVLVSDEFGNGSWGDAANLRDDDWLPGVQIPGGGPSQLSLYLNSAKYEYVGIGTETPKQKLHIVNGNILLSRPPTDNPCSLNGSILFGDFPSNDWPNGEWGIEYYNEGLNFWKVASANNPGANNCLFLKNNGNVGIATGEPLDKFQVNEGFEKLTIGSANYQILGPGTSYVGFNATRDRGNWLMVTNGTFNGGNITYGDIEGNYYIVTIPNTSTGSEEQILTDAGVVGCK